MSTTEPERGGFGEVKLGFIGAGSMGGAIIRGLLAENLVRPEKLSFYDPAPAVRAEMQNLGIEAAINYQELMDASVVLLAVKPQVMDKVLSKIKEFVRPWHLIISIAAGVPLTALEKALGLARVIRVMPNTPTTVGAGMAAVAPGSRATEEDISLALELFLAVGRAIVVEEKLLDAVTGLSASGVAFVAVFMEALADGGVKMGLARPLALELAAQTVLGTARLCLETGQHPAVLKDIVASPGGTTIAGLHALELGGFRGAVISAVEAATRRAKELASG